MVPSPQASVDCLPHALALVQVETAEVPCRASRLRGGRPGCDMLGAPAHGANSRSAEPVRPPRGVTLRMAGATIQSFACPPAFG